MKRFSKSSVAAFILMISLTGCESCGDEVVQGIITLAETPMVQKRIAGVQFLDLSKPNGNDNVLAINGFLCVVHNPGCGWWGNNGEDKFFSGAKTLPLLCKVDRVEFIQFWPNGIDSDSGAGGIGGWGSYGTEPQPMAPDGSVEIRWFNACQGTFGGKNLHYRISFIITMPVGADIGEDVFDVNGEIPVACKPENYSEVRQTGTNTPPAPTVTEASGFAGSVKYCNAGSVRTSGTLHIEGKCTPQAGAKGSATMTEDIAVSFDPSAGGIPSTAAFKTKLLYQQGTWEITKVQIIGLTNQLPGLPLTINLPGAVGTPVFDFNSGLPCRQ